MGKVLAATLVSIGLCGCSKSTLDLSTQEKFTQSLNEMRHALDEERKRELDEAVMFYCIGVENVPNSTQPAFDRSMRELDGLSADEIIAIVSRKRAENPAPAQGSSGS